MYKELKIYAKFSLASHINVHLCYTPFLSNHFYLILYSNDVSYLSENGGLRIIENSDYSSRYRLGEVQN